MVRYSREVIEWEGVDMQPEEVVRTRNWLVADSDWQGLNGQLQMCEEAGQVAVICWYSDANGENAVAVTRIESTVSAVRRLTEDLRLIWGAWVFAVVRPSRSVYCLRKAAPFVH